MSAKLTLKRIINEHFNFFFTLRKHSNGVVESHRFDVQRR